MNIDEVVAIWKNRELLADKMSTLITIQENLREGLTLDVYATRSPKPDTLWVGVRDNIKHSNSGAVQLRHIDHETFKEYRKPKLKFSLRLTGDCDLDMTADTETRALHILGSTAWRAAYLTIFKNDEIACGFTTSRDCTLVTHGPDGYVAEPALPGLKRMINCIHNQVEFSFETNPNLRNTITPQ